MNTTRIRRLTGMLIGLVIVVACPALAQAGLYENITAEGGVSWGVDMSADEATLGVPLEKALITKPRKAKLIDERYDPSLMVRTLFVSTFEDSVQEVDDNGDLVFNDDNTPKLVDSTRMDPSLFGHREGFVMESVEIGLGGRFNKYGLYYKAKLELVPREKDGNRSSDYLKDAYLGWDYYSVFDLRVGRMKIPFSQANMTSTGKRYTIYAPTLNTLIPKRQVGIMMAFSDPWQIFTLSGGTFNSVKQAIEQMKTLDQLMYVGRADFRIDNLLRTLNVHALDLELRLGANIAWVKENFDPTTEHRWIGFDAHAHLWIFTVEGELVLKDYYEPGETEDDLVPQRGWGWHWDLIVHAWPGVIDVVGRVEMMDGDDLPRGFNTTFAIDELSKQKKMWYTFGLTFHPWKYARIDLNYIMRQEKEGYNFDNDVIVGMFQLDF